MGRVNPCARCTDATTVCPCPRFLAWDAAVNPPPPEPECCTTCLDIEWMWITGEARTQEQMAARMTMHPDSVRRHLRQCERDDLRDLLTGRSA